MHRIVHLEANSLVADLRPPTFAHDWVTHAKTAADEVRGRLAGATIAITNKVPIRAADIAALPDLQMIAVSPTGANIVDLDACRARGIVVSNIRGYAVHTVPVQPQLLQFAVPLE